MKMRIFYFLLFLACFFSQEIEIKAQCCAAGNPLNISPDFQRSNRNDLKISLLFRNSISDTYYNENEVIDINYVDNSGFNYLELGAEYGLIDWLSLRIETGYYLSKFETYKNPDFEKKNAYGLADLNIAARFDLYKKPSRKLQISGIAGIKLPVGVFDLVVDNIKLPVQLQPSSGSFRYHGGIQINKAYLQNKINVFLGSSVEFSQRIQSKNFDYKYGTVYMIALGSGYKLNSKLNFLMQGRVEIRKKSQRENNQIVEASGGTIVMAVPQISYQAFEDWNLSLAFSTPIYRKYNSIQLGNKHSFSFILTRNNVKIQRKTT